MKRAWIAIGLIAASLVLGGVEYLYTANAAQIYTDLLNQADAHMEHNEAYEAQSVTERLDHRFSKDAGVLHIFNFHSDVNAVANDLAALRRYAMTGSIPEYLAVSAQAKRRILTLFDIRAPRLGNILY